MGESINCSILSDAAKFLKQLSETFFKLIDKICDSGLMSDVKQGKDGEVTSKLHIGGDIAECTMKPNEKHKGAWDVEIIPNGKKKITLTNIPEKNFQDELLKTLREVYPDAEFQEIKSSHSMKVKLQKIVSAKEISVQCVGINANYAPAQTLDDLCNVLNDDAFLDMIPENLAMFEITDLGDDYVIDATDDFECDIDLSVITGYALTALIAVMNEIWTGRLDNATLVTYRDMLIADLDELSKYANTAISYSSADLSCTQAYQAIQHYISALQYYSCNISSECADPVESILDNLAEKWESITLDDCGDDNVVWE